MDFDFLESILEPFTINCSDLEQRVRVVCDLHRYKDLTKPSEAYSLRWRMRTLLVVINQEIQFLEGLRAKINEELEPTDGILVVEYSS